MQIYNNLLIKCLFLKKQVILYKAIAFKGNHEPKEKNIINGIIIFMYLASLCTVGCAIDRFHAFAKTLLRYFRN